MELREVMEKRRSTREFSHKEIEKEKIVDLIECARLSPSAANRQNWYFVVVEKDMKNKIADIMEKQLCKQKDNMNSIEKATKPHIATSSLVGSIKVIHEAPILILVFRYPNEKGMESDYLSIGSAIEHICLRATDLNLGSLWIRDIVYTRKEIAQEVGHEDMELVSAVAIGYSIEFPYERKKKILEDIMEWYKNDE